MDIFASRAQIRRSAHEAASNHHFGNGLIKNPFPEGEAAHATWDVDFRARLGVLNAMRAGQKESQQ